MNETYFEQLGRLVGPLPEKQVAYGCDTCNEVWYGHEEMSPDGRHPRPDQYCPNCGGTEVSEKTTLPGALVVKSWVDWPADCPSMATEASSGNDTTRADQTAGRRPPQS